MRKLGQNQLDRLFESQLGDAEMPASDKVWAGIANELEKDKLRRMVYWYRSAAVASVLLLMGLGTWMLATQFGNGARNAAEFAGAKPAKGWERAFSPIDCNAATGRELATRDKATDRQNGRNFNTNAAWGPETFVRNTNPKHRSAVVAMEWQSSAKGDPALVATDAMQKRAIDRDNTRLSSRHVTIMPMLDGRADRVQAGNGYAEMFAFAEMPQEKPAKQRKEKEFAFVVDSETTEKDPRMHWELGAGFAPDMTFASTTPVQQGSTTARIIADDPAEADTKRLSPVMAYSSGIRAAYDISKRLSVRSGATFMHRQTSALETVSSFGKTDSYASTLNLSSLEIPVSMKYNIVAGKHIDYYVASGFSGNFLLRYDNTQTSASGKVGARRVSTPDEIMKPSQANILLSTGLKYHLMDRLNLQFEPGLRYGFANNEYSFSQSRPVSLNLVTGLHFQF